MSLLDDFKKEYILMDKERQPDGEGGFTTAWREGVRISMIERHDTTIEAQIAESNKTASAYTFLVDPKIKLAYHDVVKRVEDGAIFRITTPSGEAVTPKSASFQLTAVKAEKWSLTE